MKLESIKLSERSQTQKVHIAKVFVTFSTDKFTETESKVVVSRRWGFGD